MKILYKNYSISWYSPQSYTIKRESDELYITFTRTLLEAYQTIDYLAQSELIPNEPNYDEDDF